MPKQRFHVQYHSPYFEGIKPLVIVGTVTSPMKALQEALDQNMLFDGSSTSRLTSSGTIEIGYTGPPVLSPKPTSPHKIERVTLRLTAIADDMVERQAEIETNPPVVITDIVKEPGGRIKRPTTELNDMIRVAMKEPDDSDPGNVRHL